MGEGVRFCPRGNYRGSSVHWFSVKKDPDVREVAHMVAAGIDRNYTLHPCYEAYVEVWGKERAEEIIRGAVEILGACDLIQTHEVFAGLMGIQGFALFGGLSEDGKEFIFYEWGWDGRGPRPRMWVSITPQDARDIVSGRKKRVLFHPLTEDHLAARKRAKKK